jgi:hypothetical protein
MSLTFCLQQSTAFYGILRHPTASYGILRHSTAFYGTLRHSTAAYGILRHVYGILRHVYGILWHTRLRHLRGFFESFVSIWKLWTFITIMMDNIEDWLAQVHGILQGNADGFKGSLVFGNAMPEQSTKAIVKLESAVEWRLTSVGQSGGVWDGLAAFWSIGQRLGRSGGESGGNLDGSTARVAEVG